MRRIWLFLAAMAVGASLMFFLLVPRNEYAWMATELPAGSPLPIDDLQRAKEITSLVLLGLSLSALAGFALVRRRAAAIAAAVVVSGLLLAAWHQLFWAM